MRRKILKDAEKYGERFVVAGAHWSWGGGYKTEDAARSVLNRNEIAFGYHACPVCGTWVAGLADGPCANCAK